LLALQEAPEKIVEAQEHAPPIYDSSHYRMETSTGIDQVSRKEAPYRSLV
jgi:hypothetical protein